MITILIALFIGSAVLVGVLFWYSDSGFNDRHAFAGAAGVVLAIITIFAALACIPFVWNWYAAETKAQVINREWGTNYTAKEVYFASDVIDLLREIDRKRIEVNGDLLREEPN